MDNEQPTNETIEFWLLAGIPIGLTIGFGMAYLISKGQVRALSRTNEKLIFELVQNTKKAAIESREFRSLCAAIKRGAVVGYDATTNTIREVV